MEFKLFRSRYPRTYKVYVGQRHVGQVSCTNGRWTARHAGKIIDAGIADRRSAVTAVATAEHDLMGCR